MKFKIIKGTETYEQLREFDKKLDKQHLMLINLMEEFNAEAYSPPCSMRIGSKLSFQFTKGKPEGWKVYDKSRDLYIPKVGTTFEQKIKKLPKLLNRRSDIGSIINFIQDFVENADGSKRYTIRPRVYFVEAKELYIVDTGNGGHDCIDMREILESEFHKLSHLL